MGIAFLTVRQHSSKGMDAEPDARSLGQGPTKDQSQKLNSASS